FSAFFMGAKSCSPLPLFRSPEQVCLPPNVPASFASLAGKRLPVELQARQTGHQCARGKQAPPDCQKRPPPESPASSPPAQAHGPCRARLGMTGRILSGAAEFLPPLFPNRDKPSKTALLASKRPPPAGATRARIYSISGNPRRQIEAL